jgi:hypothetical protein
MEFAFGNQVQRHNASLASPPGDLRRRQVGRLGGGNQTLPAEILCISATLSEGAQHLVPKAYIFAVCDACTTIRRNTFWTSSLSIPRTES